MTNEQQQVSYEAVYLRYHPEPHFGERVNVGVVVFAPATGQVASRLTRLRSRVSDLFPGAGAAFLDQIRTIRRQLETIAPERQHLLLGRELTLKELLNVRVSSIRPTFSWSDTRYGICDNLSTCADELYEEVVGRLETRRARERVDAAEIWSRVSQDPGLKQVLERVERKRVLRTEDREHEFRAAWMNGTAQVADAISLDYANPEDMLQHAELWSGRLVELGRTNSFKFTGVLSTPPEDRDRRSAYQRAVRLLGHNERVRELIPESEAPRLADLISADIADQQPDETN